jgi:hypothetical protein
MPEEVHRDAEKYTIWWESELNAVAHRWDEFASGEQFRDGCEELLDVIRERDASKLLVDTSGIRAHDDEDQAWLQEDWVPRIIEEGIDTSAMVHPDSVIAEMDMEAFMDEAREWLAEQ